MKPIFDHLLAKSIRDPKDPDDSSTLLGHTRNTIDAIKVFCDILNEPMNDFIGGELSNHDFTHLACVAAWLHDLGKANDNFQMAVRGKKKQQGARHEAVALVVIFDFLKDWLAPLWSNLPYWAFDCVLCAVAGHHLKFPDEEPRAGTRLTFLGTHRDFVDFLLEGSNSFGLPTPPLVPDFSYSLLKFDGDFLEKLVKIKRMLTNSIVEKTAKKTVAALKALLMCADLAGSALPRCGENVQKWLMRRIEKTLCREDLIDVVQDRLKGALPKPFQQALAEAAEKTVILEAGCGAGKTVGAYLWASKHAAGRRLFFCYPTTITASEGFLGYMQDPAFEAILKHSRAEVDYRLLEGLPEKSREQCEIQRLGLEALESWPVPVVVCTVHNVLGILENFRSALYEWPSIVRSAFIFDEVHSYSQLLFEHLLKFIQTFNHVPVLLMTASLPIQRKEALLQAAAERGTYRLVKGPPERERAKRYHITNSSLENAWNTVSQTLEKGGKVLWICNTVGSAFEKASQADESGLSVELFHSRFRYRDRLKRQRYIIEAFAKTGVPIFAITTQIAEMSLDLSADLLVSEIAPVPALVQRLGRLNRFSEIPHEISEALIIEPSNGFPYGKSKDDLAWAEISRRWIDELKSLGEVSQAELMESYFRISSSEKISEFNSIICSWIDDPVRSQCKNTIMEPGYTIELVRFEDLNLGDTAEMAIPMPFPNDGSWMQWEKKGRYLISPPGTVRYDEKRGASYAKRQSDPWII